MCDIIGHRRPIDCLSRRPSCPRAVADIRLRLTGLSKDWRNWKPYKHSQPSASLRTTSKTKSINLVPVYPKTKLFSLKGWSKGVHQNGTWHVAVSPLRVPRTNCFVEVYIDAFKLLNDLKNARQKMASVLCCFYHEKSSGSAHLLSQPRRRRHCTFRVL